MKRRWLLVSFCAFLVCVLCFSLVPSLGMAEDQAVVDSINNVENVEVIAVDGVDANKTATADDATSNEAVPAAPTDQELVDAEDPASAGANVASDANAKQDAEAQPAPEEQIVAEQQEEEPVAVEAEGTAEAAAQLAGVTEPTVTYHTHVQTYGWQGWVSNGDMSGTEGESKRLEGIEIGVKVPGLEGGIRYKTHVQTYGWQDWSSNGAMSGTSGESKRLEGIQIELTGAIADKYDVWYRTHVQTYGWQGWCKNGEVSGTTGESKRLEGIEIKLMRKGGSSLVPVEGARVNYNVHCQTYGWLGTMIDGEAAGTTGESKRLEGINIALGSQIAGGIRYKTHVQTYGWETEWNYDGASSGTTGESKRLEAIQIELTGDAAKNYDVWYRVHAQTYGWLGWAKNGEAAGTSGRSRRLEAIEILVLDKDSAAPGDTNNHMLANSLIYLDAGHGMSGSVGYDTGAVGSGYEEADLNKELVNKIVYYAREWYGLNVYPNIDCDYHYTKRQEHASSVGATSLVSIHFNSASSGATGYESYIYRAYDQYQGAAAPRSDVLQQIMHSHLSNALPLTDRGMRSEAFAVVNGRYTGIPATLLEVCFISNASDMQVYQAHKEQVAQELAAGLNEAYQQGF